MNGVEKCENQSVGYDYIISGTNPKTTDKGMTLLANYLKTIRDQIQPGSTNRDIVRIVHHLEFFRRINSDSFPHVS